MINKNTKSKVTEINNFELEIGKYEGGGYQPCHIILGDDSYKHSGMLGASIVNFIRNVYEGKEKFTCFEEGFKYHLFIDISSNKAIIQIAEGPVEGKDTKTYRIDKDLFLKEILVVMKDFLINDFSKNKDKLKMVSDKNVEIAIDQVKKLLSTYNNKQ